VGAIAPDIDHQNSEASKKIPLINRLLKHRGPTHSFAGIIIFTALTFLLTIISPIVSIALALLSLFGASLLSKNLQRLSQKLFDASDKAKKTFILKDLRNLIYIINIVPWILLALSLLLVFKEELRVEVFYLLVSGYILHVIADLLTKEGVPLFWPNKSRQKLGLFKTSSVHEQILMSVLVIINFIFLYEFAVKYQVLGLEYWSIID
jgi:membrane-bound metal-dependent hydrolase YbcI (DUF457 family)